MADNQIELAAIIDRTGDRLVQAWHSAERRRRNHRRALTVVATVLVLAVPGAVAAVSFLDTSPGPNNILHRGRVAVVLGRGSTALGPWQLTLFAQRGAVCAGLRATSLAGTPTYSADCAAHRNAVSLGVVVVPRGTYVYGVMPDTITRVRVILGRRAYIERVLLPTSQWSAPRPLASVQMHVRGFVIGVPEATTTAPRVEGLDAGGRVAVRLP